MIENDYEKDFKSFLVETIWKSTVFTKKNLNDIIEFFFVILTILKPSIYNINEFLKFIKLGFMGCWTLIFTEKKILCKYDDYDNTSVYNK